MQTRVLLVPSVNDAHHPSVFPQPALPPHLFKDGDDDLTHNGQIASLPNPCVLDVGGVVVGVGTQDVVHHQFRQDVYKLTWKGPSDKRPKKLMRVAHNVLLQRNAYPLYPAQPGFPLDLAQARHADFKALAAQLLRLRHPRGHALRQPGVPHQAHLRWDLRQDHNQVAQREAAQGQRH